MKTAILLLMVLGGVSFASHAGGYSVATENGLYDLDGIVLSDGSRVDARDIEDIHLYEGEVESVVIDGETFFEEDIDGLLLGRHRLGGGGFSGEDLETVILSRLGGGGHHEEAESAGEFALNRLGGGGSSWL